METVLRQVRDLDQDERSALERVVGHALGEGQQLIIQVTGDSPPATNGSASIAGQLPSWCNVYEGLSSDQFDDLHRSIVRVPAGRDL